MKRVMTALAILAGTTMSLVVRAADAEFAVCKDVFSGGVYDRSALLAESYSQETFRNAMCKLDRTDLSKFKSQSASLGLSIPIAEALIGIDGSYQANNQQFSQSIQQFCTDTNYATTAFNRLSTATEEINRSVIGAWQMCIDTMAETIASQEGIVAYAIPQPGLDAFLISVKFRTNINPAPPLVINSITPSKKVKCTYAGKPVVPDFSVTQRDFVLECTKPASERVQVLFSTNVGAAKSFPIDAVENPATRMERLERRLDVLAGVPSGMVAYFDARECPNGWRKKENTQGRYVVGLNLSAVDSLGETVGQQLSDKENRATGKHVHTILDASIGGNVSDGVGSGGYNRKRTTSYTTEPLSGGVDGTNAPYIQLLGCQKL